MRSQKPIQLAACFAAALIIFIPMCISDAYAASLNVTRISGAEGVSNFVKKSDELTIEVEASISENEDVLPGSLRIYKDASTSYGLFTECSNLPNSSSIFKCSYSQFSYLFLSQQSFRISLHSASDSINPVASATENVYLDGLGAKIASFSANPQRSSTGQVSFQFRAEDYATSAGDTSICSGIDRVDFFEGDISGQIIASKSPESKTCIFESSFSYQLQPSSDATTVCAKAYDMFDQSATQSECVDVYYDNAAPLPMPGSARIVKAGTDEQITHIGQQAINADISIAIDAEDLDESTLSADFSVIAGSLFSSKEPSSHTQEEGVHYFTWKGIPIGSMSSCIFYITAEDEIGNSAKSPVSCSITIDNKGPSVKSISTPYINEDTGIYYFGKLTTMTALISEDGIGLNNARIEADFSNINGVPRKMADECVEISLGNWECYWYDIVANVPDSQYYVTIYKESKDDLGNIMDAKYDQVVGVDTTSPTLNQNVEFTIIPGTTEIPYEGIAISGDLLEFIIQVDDVYSAYANFSAIGAGDEVLPAACWAEEGKNYCVWQVSVQSSGPYEAEIIFSFEDFSGNRNSIAKSVSVAGLIEEPSPNYWQSSVKCSPSLIDRDIASLVSLQQYCHISLSPIREKTASLESFSMSAYPSSCKALTGNNTIITDYINNIILFNNAPGSEDPYLQLTLNVASFMMDKFEYSCDFEIYTKIGDEYTLNPEIETVSIPMEFYNLPIGVMASSYESKVERARDQIDIVGKWFEDLVRVFNYAEKACNMYSMLHNIWAVLVGIAVVFGIVSQTEPYGSGFFGAWKVTCMVEGETKQELLGPIASFLDPLCAFVNCKWSQKILDQIYKDVGKNSMMVSGGAKQSLLEKAATGSIAGKGFNPKQSIVWSTITLCVPGMIYNVEKYRQIQCRYATCLMADVPAGIPVYTCEETRAFETCAFYFGQLFNAIPFVQMISNYMGIIEGYISNPFSAAGWLMTLIDNGLKCSEQCKSAETKAKAPYWMVCAIFTAVNMIAKVVTDVNTIAQPEYYNAGNAFCDQYHKTVEKYEASQS